MSVSEVEGGIRRCRDELQVPEHIHCSVVSDVRSYRQPTRHRNVETSADIEAKAVVGSAGMMKPEEGKYRGRYGRSPRRRFVDLGACPIPPCFADQPWSYAVVGREPVYPRAEGQRENVERRPLGSRSITIREMLYVAAETLRELSAQLDVICDGVVRADRIAAARSIACCRAEVRVEMVIARI